MAVSLVLVGGLGVHVAVLLGSSRSLWNWRVAARRPGEFQDVCAVHGSVTIVDTRVSTVPLASRRAATASQGHSLA